MVYVFVDGLLSVCINVVATAAATTMRELAERIFAREQLANGFLHGCFARMVGFTTVHTCVIHLG